MDNSNKCGCGCGVETSDKEKKKINQSKVTWKGIPSIILTVLIAFFPKCPVCWAAYMSLFGSLGLAQLPYMGWLLPVMSILLVVHLYFLYKKVNTHGYWPLSLSIAGSGIILLGKTVFLEVFWIVYFGMGLIILASLMISFSVRPMKYIMVK